MDISLKQFQFDKKKFRESSPFPHLIIDDFLPDNVALEILNSFPSKKDIFWTPYIHFNEYKFGCSDYDKFPYSIKKIFDVLLSEEFCHELSILLDTKIFSDPQLIGGGLHQTFRNGYLNIHSDFSHHPHNIKWKRKLNLIIYFNKDWPASNKGNLELWDKDKKQCVQSITPDFNRAVLFLTDNDSLHGSPEIVNCKKEESRKSIALYYYENTESKEINATKYYYFNKNLIIKLITKLENLLLKIFTVIRQLLKLNH